MGPTYDLSDLPEAMRAAVAKDYSRILIKPDMKATVSSGAKHWQARNGANIASGDLAVSRSLLRRYLLF